MNPAHVHLLTNHLPILGSVFGLLVLIYSFLLRKPSQQVRTAAYLILVVAAIGAVAANASGEGAEESVKRLPGVTHDAIEEHEDAATFALGAALAAGALSLFGIAANAFKPAWNGRLAVANLLVALFSLAVSARTGYLGGKIRHTELDHPPAIEGHRGSEDH
jgi:hypothetical protein